MYRIWCRKNLLSSVAMKKNRCRKNLPSSVARKNKIGVEKNLLFSVAMNNKIGVDVGVEKTCYPLQL